jgi:integrase
MPISSPRQGQWKRGTISVHVQSLRSFLPYLEKRELDALLDAPDRSTERGHRNYAVLLFLYNSGARASEAVHVTIGDIQSEVGTIGFVQLHGKGRKARTCPLWKRTMTELATLTANRPDSDRVFLNRRGGPLTRFGLHALVERHAKVAAQSMPSLARKRVSPHTIRHYLPFLTMSRPAILASFSPIHARSYPDIVLTPCHPRAGEKGVPP